MNARNDDGPKRGDAVLLVARGPLGDWAAMRLQQRFPGLVVLREEAETKATIIRRRMRLLGAWAALGQVAAGVVFRLIALTSRQRRSDLVDADLGDVSGSSARPRVIEVGSVNSRRCRRALQLIRPKVVAVYGTRLISRQTLAAVDAPFINLHSGINPKYRGQHPAYWARVAGDLANAGVTVHLVDAGVDTGDVIAQAHVAFESGDTIATYPYVQMATGLGLLGDSIRDALAGQLRARRVELPSKLWFPPTVWQYVWNGAVKGVW